MTPVAQNVFLLDGFPRHAINVYLIGDVLLDAGTRHAAGRILRQIGNRRISAHALTHAHPDHQGSSHAVCTKLDVPLWCPAGDADAMESGDFSRTSPLNWSIRLQHRFWTGPAHPVARRLSEGDVVGEFAVVEAPGHSPGQAAYWRESDRVLILGDVLNGMNLVTMAPGLHEPPVAFTVDPRMNRESARRLASLNPRVICFGHGRPWRDPDAFQEFVARLR